MVYEGLIGMSKPHFDTHEHFSRKAWVTARFAPSDVHPGGLRLNEGVGNNRKMHGSSGVGGSLQIDYLEIAKKVYSSEGKQITG